MGNRALGRMLTGGAATIQRKTDSSGMPDNLKQGLEAQSGMDLSDVKVHYNSDKPSQVGAHAYAQGSDIHVAPGQEKHLPHEGWHVVQQRQGRVKPSRMLDSGEAVNDDPSLEREADAMGAKAVQMKADSSLAGPEGAASSAGPEGTHSSQAAASANDGRVGTAASPAGGVAQLAWVPLSEGGKRFAAAILQFLAGSLEIAALKHSADADMTDETNAVAIGAAEFVRGKASIEGADKNALKSKSDQIRANEMEHAEGGHSLARHGPDVSDAQLMKRLLTGIAPDDKLSPAPGSSSQFVDYASVLKTRQKASEELNTAIAIAQSKVLEWKVGVLPGLAGVTEAKRLNKVAKTGDKKSKEDALAHHRESDLKGKRVNVDKLKEDKETLLDRLSEIDRELKSGKKSGGGGGLFGFGGDDDDGEDLTLEEIEEHKRNKLLYEVQLVELEERLKTPEAELNASLLEETRLSGEVQAGARELGTATSEHDAAVDEQANPGKSLAGFLKKAGVLKLEVKDEAGRDPFKGTVTMLDQYSIVVEHTDQVGKGFEGQEEVKLTDVFTASAADQSTDPPTPKAEGEIRTALQGLGLTRDVDDFAAFLAVPDNLKLAKAKGEKSGKVYKTTSDAGALTRTFTNYKTADVKLFEDGDTPVAVNTTDWKAIQHFPVKDTELGVQEKA